MRPIQNGFYSRTDRGWKPEGNCLSRVHPENVVLNIAEELCHVPLTTWHHFAIQICLLGLVIALYRAKLAYSHQTFPPTICWSVCVCERECLSVCLSVCPVHCGKTADRIWMQFWMVDRMGPGMRQVVGFVDQSMGGGNFRGKCGAPHCHQWGVWSVVVPSKVTLEFLVSIVTGIREPV